MPNIRSSLFLTYFLAAILLTSCSDPKPRRPSGPPPSQSQGASLNLSDPKTQEALQEIARTMGREMGREAAKELKKELGNIQLSSTPSGSPSPSTTQDQELVSKSKPTVSLAHCTPAVREYYEARPKQFTLTTLDNIPDDLVWDDGSKLEPFSSPDAVKGGTFQDFMLDFPRTLRFLGPDANGSFRNYILDYNAMYLAHPYPNGDGDYPGLATKWAIAPDGKTIYFKLNSKARYSDGKPVRATDYFFHFYFMRSPHITAPWYNDFWGEEKYPNITIYDKETISITHWKAKPDIVERCGQVRPVPEHFYQELDEFFVEDYQWKMEPTPGAYHVLPENVNKGTSITLTRVPDWWADDLRFFKNRFNPEKINVMVVREMAKAFELFKKGEIDIHGLALPKYWYDQLADNSLEVEKGYIHKIQFYNQIPRPTYGLRINTSLPHLDNRDVRLGIQYALNWDLVLDRVFRGDFVRMNTVTDGYGSRSHPSLQARKFDIGKALEHFAKAGFKQRDADGILTNDKGEKLSFTISTGYKPYEDVLTVLKQEAPKAGLELHLDMLEPTSAWKKIQEKKHQIAFFALGVSVEMYPRFWETYHSDNAYKLEGDAKYNADGSLKPGLEQKMQTNNATITAVREIDHLINTYRESESLEEITRIAHTLGEKLHEEAAFVPGWVKPWYRIGHWRWVKFPEHFDGMESTEPGEFHVHWIDEKAKEETLKAMETGAAFEKAVKVLDPYHLRKE